MFSRVFNIFSIISITLGVIIGILFANGLISYIRTVFKINLVLSALLFIIYAEVLTLFFFLKNKHIKSVLLMPGIPFATSCIASLVLSIVALAVPIYPVYLFVRILVGVAGFFFSYMILSAVNFICALAHKALFNDLT